MFAKSSKPLDKTWYQADTNKLNKNNNRLNKVFQRLANGQRINSTGDSASEYGISEKMRNQIRALVQDVQNVQNGATMLKIAHGGIQEIVNDLRTMKDLAINAANDSNTDADRAIIQKEFEQRRAAIDDIASWTNYNTKPLLDGTYYNASTKSTTSLGVDDIVTDLFGLEKGTIHKSGPTVQWFDGKTGYRVDASSDGEDSDELVSEEVALDFSNAKLNGASVSFPNDLDQQGFTILCQVESCPSFCGFKFDASMDIGSGELLGGDSTLVYSVGIKDATTARDVVEALSFAP